MNKAETLSIHFYKIWTLSFVFSDYKDGSSNNSYFYINRINLTYSMDNAHFPKLSGRFDWHFPIISQVEKNKCLSTVGDLLRFAL